MTQTDDRGPEFTIVTRDIDLGIPPDELWSLIGDGEGWASWMVDAAAVDVTPGSGGAVTDGDEVRHVAITGVEPGERVRFQWWPADRVDLASSVSLAVRHRDDGFAVLEVVEVFPPEAPVDTIEASVAWGVRALRAWASCRALAGV